MLEIFLKWVVPFVLGLFIGGIVGVAITCCCVAGGRSDRDAQ